VRLDGPLRVWMNWIFVQWKTIHRRHMCRCTIILVAASLWILGKPGVTGSANRHPESDVREDANRSARTTDEKRPVTMEDAIEMTRLADPYYVGGGSSNGRVAQFSPDKTKFVVVLRKGDIHNNSNEFSLLMWRPRDIYRAPKPEVLLTLSSTSNRPAIQSVRWRKDNETLLFLGEHNGEIQQLYSFNCRTRELRKITSSPTNVLSYGVGGADLIAYTAEPLPDMVTPSWQRLGRPISTQLITDVMLGHPDEEWSDHVRVILQHGQIETSSVLSEKFLMPFPGPDDQPVVSPDGRYVLLLTLSEHISASWRDYPDSRMQKWTHWNIAPGQYSMLLRYVLFDTKERTQSALIDAPISIGGRGSEAIWLADSRSVVITNSYLPLENVSREEREARLQSPFVAEIKIPSGDITKISSKELKLVGQDERTNDLIFEEGRINPKSLAESEVRFRKHGDQWENVEPVRHMESSPAISLEEGLNLAPRIIATQAGQESRILLDLNPQFDKLAFGREERIRWKARDGHEVEGGLYYPVNFVPGRRYPLVIQTHGFQPDRFEIDGPYTSAFAAQPLAGKGIMVLQAEAPDRAAVIDHLATSKEVEWRVAAYEGAIDDLDSKGLIDRARVGIMGFSRTCWYVKYALTHSHFRYATASLSDGIDMGYFTYAAMANRGYPDDEIDEIMEAIPSGTGMEPWVKRSPDFNIDKLPNDVPIRVVAGYPLDVLVEWEWFAMMRRLQKPVDMVVFLDGIHVLEKPLNRLISQGGNVDWFDFWLNGHEDPDPVKSEQYERWRKLREVTKDSRQSVE
jgi:hypothetical protein